MRDEGIMREVGGQIKEKYQKYHRVEENEVKKVEKERYFAWGKESRDNEKGEDVEKKKRRSEAIKKEIKRER